MLSHSRIKFLRSLQTSKYRTIEKSFLVEGTKLLSECMNGGYSNRFQLQAIFGTADWMEEQESKIAHLACDRFRINQKQLEQISSMKTPNQVVAMFTYRPEPIITPVQGELYLATDQVQDPGNMGTLFRLAEWFGVQAIFLSQDSADPLNPKVIQAGMGSVLRIPYFRGDLLTWLESHRGIPCYGTLLSGEPIDNITLNKGGIIIMGNESKGIRPQTQAFINQALLIPKHAANPKYPESLNVATAAAIVLNEFRRNS